MTEANNHTHTENQDERALNFLRDVIASLKSRLTKKDDRIATLDVMLNTVMESHNAEVRAYEDLKDHKLFLILPSRRLKVKDN